MECFRVCKKSELLIATPGFLFCFVLCFFFFAPCIWQALFFSGGLVQLPIKFPFLYKHFTGCIRNVYINHEFLDLSQPLYNDGTSAKCKAMGNTCAYKPCGRGTCFNILGSHRCDCPTGFDGSRGETGIEFFFYGYVSNLSSRTYFSLKRSQEYGIFWNIFK